MRKHYLLDFGKLQEMSDRITLHGGMLFQEYGIIEPAEEGTHRYHVVAELMNEGICANTKAAMRIGSVSLSIGAKTPEDVIRKWVQSLLFPHNAYEVNAFESPESYRRGDKPLATLRGDEQI